MSREGSIHTVGFEGFVSNFRAFPESKFRAIRDQICTTQGPKQNCVGSLDRAWFPGGRHLGDIAEDRSAVRRPALLLVGVCLRHREEPVPWSRASSSGFGFRNKSVSMCIGIRAGRARKLMAACMTAPILVHTHTLCTLPGIHRFPIRLGRHGLGIKVRTQPR